MLWGMVSRSLVAGCGRTALVCLFATVSWCAAQNTSTQQQPAAQSQQQQPSSPAPAAPPPAQTNQPLQLHDLPPDSHTLTPEQQAEARREQAIQAALQLARLQARWGPEMSTPGLSTSLVETGRTKTPDGATQISYHVTGNGYTPGDSLSLVRWPLNAESDVVMRGITLDPNGTAICPEKPLAPVPTSPGAPPQPAPKGPECRTVMAPGQPVVVTETVAEGEPVRIALIDNDRQKGAATTLVPFPRANEDKGCRLQVMLGLKDASMVLVEGTGFPPKTPLKLEVTNNGHTRTLNPTATDTGRFVVVDMPAQQGEDAGSATVRFAGITHVPSLEDSKNPAPADPTCAPAVTFPWGKGSYRVQ